MTLLQRRVLAFGASLVLVVVATFIVIDQWATENCHIRAEGRESVRGAFQDLVDALDPAVGPNGELREQSPRTLDFQHRLDDRLKPISC